MGARGGARLPLEIELRKPWMISGTGTLPIPTKLPLRLLDAKIVDARETSPHQTVWVEFPILIGAEAKLAAGPWEVPLRQCRSMAN
jgi:hypothetical protein